MRKDLGYTNKEVKYAKDLKAKVKYSVTEVIEFGKTSTSTATTTPYFDFGDSWTSGVWFRTLAQVGSGAATQKGLTSAAKTSDYKQSGSV